MGILAFSIFVLIYKARNPHVLPGLTEKIIWTLVILLIFLIIVSLNYSRILRRIQVKLIKRKRRLIGKKKQIFFEKAKKFGKEKIFEIKSTEDYLRLAINYIFQFLLVVFLIFLLINEFRSIEFINLNYFLITVLVFGILTILFEPPKQKQRKSTKFDYWFIFLLGITGGILIFIKIKSLGTLSYIISIIATILIILLSYLLLEEKEDEE